MPDDDDEKNPNQDDKGGGGSRMDAAKAFFRAMYAGDEPAAGDNSQGTGDNSQGPPVDSRRVKELEQQVKELDQQLGDADKINKRMAADFDNFRRRMDREREELSNAGVRKAAEAIIPALDDLDRALMYLSPDTPAEKIIESFQLVATRVIQCLETAGLKRFGTKGALFDPRYHEPVQQIETSEYPDGTVVHELRGGYMLGDRVIRPAMVNVALNNSINIAPLDGMEGPGGPQGPAPEGPGGDSGPSRQKGPSSAAPSADSGPIIPLGPSSSQSQDEEDTELERKGGSVATATEEKSDEASTAKAAASTAEKPDDRVYDLGDL